MNQRSFKMTFLCLRRSLAFGGRLLCLLILFSFFGCKKKPSEDYLEPVNVSNTSGESTDPSIAVDSKGTVHLVWTEDRGSEEEHIRYAKREKDGTWSEPINVSNTQHSARFPSLAVDREDGLHLAWQQWIDDTLRWGWLIFYSYKPFGGNWSVPETVTGGYLDAIPKITVDNMKNVHMVWEYGWYSRGIGYRRRDPDGTWSVPEVAVVPARSVFAPSLTTDREGNVHICWLQMFIDEDKSCIFYSMRTPEGNWTEPIEISATGSASISSPVCVADRSGNVHFVWHDAYKEHGDLAYRVRYANGSWSRIEPCSTTTYNLPSSAPDLAVGPDDKVYLSWDDHVSDDTTRSICLAKRVNGKWEGKVVAKFVGGPTRLAIDYLGNAHIAFEGIVRPMAGVWNKDIFYIEVKREEQ